MKALYHVWFSTKRRQWVLEGEIGDEAKRLFVATAERTRIDLMEVEAYGDHVHLLVAVAKGQTLPSVMHQLKGATARYIFLKYPDLKLDLGHSSFWQKGYGWRKIAESEVPTIRHYIRTQKERPPRRNA
ncbi:MAG: IS200/IS605 family transposase [Conexibacter sp.]